MPPIRLKTKLFGDWEKARSLLNNAGGVKAAIHAATLAEAQMARRNIVKGIRDQAPGGKQFLALSAMTLAARRLGGFRGTKALIVTGSLIKSIIVKSPGRGLAFVGVLRSARGEDGRMLYNVARVQEMGATIAIRVTPRMRKYIMLMMRKAFPGARGRDKKTGKFTSARFRPSGAGSLRTGTLIVRIPPRPSIMPVIEQHFANPAKVAQRFTHRVAVRLGMAVGKPGA